MELIKVIHVKKKPSPLIWETMWEIHQMILKETHMSLIESKSIKTKFEKWVSFLLIQQLYKYDYYL